LNPKGTHVAAIVQGRETQGKVMPITARAGAKAKN
jgi:hypothetical protein